jgi:ribosomal protein S18 acetylase RimI-like enzyme
VASELSIRRYRPADETRTQELHEAALRAVPGFAFVEDVPEPDLDHIEDHYLDADGEFLVGLRKGVVVAMGAFRPVAERTAAAFDSLAGPVAELKRMRVDPGHQRRGYGQRIYDELESRARERGYRELVLDTSPQQVAARRFYERNGFTEERTLEVEAFGEAFELVMYRKRLAD